jgi:site-specific DNA recombinase
MEGCNTATESGPRGSDEPNRIPAREIEDLIVARLKSFFGSPDQVVSLLACDGDDIATTHDLVQAAAHFAQELNAHSAAHLNQMLTAIMLRATVSRESVGIQCHKYAVRARLLAASETAEADLDGDNEHDVFTLEIPARLKRCGVEMRLIIPGPAASNQRQEPVPSLVKAVSRAHEWVRRIESGEFKDQRAIAVSSGLGERYVSRILPSAFLAPEMVEAILDGTQASDLTLDTLLNDVPLSWAEQRRRRLNSPHQ